MYLNSAVDRLAARGHNSLELLGSSKVQSDVGLVLDLELDLGQGLGGLVDALVDLVLLVLAVAPVALVVILLVVGLGLGLGLVDGGLDLLLDLNDAELGGTAVHGNTLLGGDQGVSSQHRHDLVAELHTNALGEVGAGEMAIDLVELLLVEARDERALDGATTGDQLIGVNGLSIGAGSSDLGGLLVEQQADGAGDLRGPGNTTNKQNLVNKQRRERGLGEQVADELRELREHATGDDLVLQAVETAAEVEARSDTVNAELGGGGVAEGLAERLGLEHKLGNRTLLLERVNLVLVLELRGKVSKHGVVKQSAAQLVVTVGGQDGEDTGVDLDDSGIGASATEVRHNEGLVLVGATQVGGNVSKKSSAELANDLHDLQASLSGKLNKLGLLGAGDISGQGKHNTIDVLADVITGSIVDTHELAHNDVVDRLLHTVDLEAGETIASLHWLGATLSNLNVDLLEGHTGVVTEVANGVSSVAEQLVLGLDTVELVVMGVREHGGNRTVTIGVGNHLHGAFLGVGDRGGGVTEANTDYSRHEIL